MTAQHSPPFNGSTANATMLYALSIGDDRATLLQPGDRVCIKSPHDSSLTWIWGVSEAGVIFQVPSGMVARDLPGNTSTPFNGNTPNVTVTTRFFVAGGQGLQVEPGDRLYVSPANCPHLPHVYALAANGAKFALLRTAYTPDSDLAAALVNQE